MSAVSLDQVNAFVVDASKNIRGEVRVDSISRSLYSTDASNYQITPLAVTLPKDRGDVITLMTLAAQYGLPVLPRGGANGGSTTGCVRIGRSDLASKINEVSAIHC